MIRVAVAGAAGRVGQIVCAAVDGAEDLELTGRADPALDTPLANVLDGADVVVDFTRPDSAVANVREAVDAGVHAVVGTTGFDVEELPFEGEGNLPLDVDPKLAWARAHLVEQPIEVNTADRAALLRVPGIGPTIADRILRARRQGTLCELSHLRKLGAAPARLAPFVLLDGRQTPRQLTLWTARGCEVAGEW